MENKNNTQVYEINEHKEYESIDDIKNKSNVIGHIVIPGVEKVDWAARVSGNGMYPKYSNGDILICRVIKDSFIQWGKVHVILTRNGALVRKLKPSSEKDSYLAETFSEDYPPFNIPKDEIVGIALVVAAIKYE